MMMAEPNVQATGMARQLPREAFKHFHLVISASVDLGIMAFFASVIMYPGEILGPSEGLTTVWILVFIVIGLNAAFFANAFFKRTHGPLLVLIGNLGSIIAILIMANQFFVYTSDNHEPWIIQMAWFIRDSGLVVGAFLGIPGVFERVHACLLDRPGSRERCIEERRSCIAFHARHILIAVSFLHASTSCTGT